MKSPLLCLVLSTVASSCTFPIATETADTEATERHVVKSTLQALKDQGETEIAQTQGIASPDESQSPGKGQPSDGSIPSQGTQAPPTVPPPDFSDVLLPTPEFFIFESPTPVVPPTISFPQGNLPVIPTYTPEPFAGGSLISFRAYKGCGRYLTLQFHLNNQSTVPLESAYATCHNTGTGNILSSSTNRPFHSSPNECAPGVERIKAGTNSHVVVYMGNERMKSGEEFYCTASVCSVDLPNDLSGVPCLVLTSPRFTAP